jgi:transcriptional regulator with XRE-family HTH domain
MDISEDIFLKELGIHLRKLREINGLSQQELANDSSVPKIQIGRIERAEVNTTVRTLIKIANALNIEPNELLTFQSKK